MVPEAEEAAAEAEEDTASDKYFAVLCHLRMSGMPYFRFRCHGSNPIAMESGNFGIVCIR